MDKNVIVELQLPFEGQLLKSYQVVSSVNDIEKVEDIVPEIKPVKGEFFFKRRGLDLKPGDWVVFGVASTPSVDLVNDAILDIKYTFGDSLEEFVNKGRIFYEHGYKHAGNKEKHPDIDIPIGIPIAAEIADNKLYVWILLDKNHELAQKIYKHLQNSDNRINKIGLSIGAIPLGKSTSKIIGNTYVNIPPKMRLYEVSITGQPINVDTFVKILKSMIYNVEEINGGKQMAKEKDLKNLLEEDKPEEKHEEDLASALEEVVQKEEPKEEENSETEEQEKVDESLLSEEEKENVLLEEDVEKELKEHEEEDKETFSYLLDKLDFIEEKLNELMSKVSPSQQEEKDEYNIMHSSLAELKSNLSNFEAKLSSLENRLLQLSDLLESNLESFAELKSFLNTFSEVKESLTKSLESIKEEKEKFIKEVETVQKSLSSLKDVQVKTVLGVNADMHPSVTMFENNTEEKLKSLLSNKAKMKSLESKLEEFISFRGTPTQISQKKQELYEFAKENFNLEPEELDIIYRKYKSNRKN